MVLADGAAVPGELRNRIFIKLLGLTGQGRAEAFRTLAQQLRSRARVHAVLDWLRHRERTVEERESGVRWLYEQPAQVLAEFIDLIAGVHQGRDEDNIVCHWLAQVLAKTNLPDACSYLHQWWLVSNHPHARSGIKHGMEALRCQPPAESPEKVDENLPPREDKRSGFVRRPLQTWLLAGAGATFIGFGTVCYVWAQGNDFALGIEKRVQKQKTEWVISFTSKHIDPEAKKHNPILIPVQQEEN
jgi:hypothetical protein